MRIILILITLLFVSGVYADDRIDDVYFSGKPISMIISIKKDSLIYFPNPVRLKDDFANHLEAMVTNDFVVIKAKAIFESKKLVFQDMVTNQIYIFTVSSSNASSPRSVRVILPKVETEKDKVDVVSNGNAYIKLTQHASMSLYYPERYTPKTRGVREVKLKKGNADYFVSFNAKSEPIRSWKGFGLFVTAVKITNLESKIITIDPRKHFRGEWLFLTPQHGWLGDSLDDNVTTVYVVSERPFWESLL
jgi:integrating conjugative element protein (TIGR03749 family)